MPLLRVKRQSATPETCPSGYQLYTCNNAQVVWTGCCAQDPCTTGCPVDARADQSDDDDSSTTSTIQSSLPTTIVTSVLTTGDAGSNVRIASASASSGAPSAAETASPTSSQLGENLVPTGVTEDPATQTIVGYENAKGDEPKSPPHTEKSDVPAIIGATLGAVGIVALISLLFFCYRRRNRRKDQRRRITGPYKRGIDNEDAASDAKDASVAGGSTRSRPRAHNSIIHDRSAYSGSNHEMRSVDGASARVDLSKPQLNDSPTSLPPMYQQTQVENSNNDASSPARNDSAAQAEQRSESNATKKSILQADPSTGPHLSRIDQVRPQMNSSGSRGVSRSPSRSPASRGVPGYDNKAHNDNVKDDPYTGEVRISRATGSTFTPAGGAKTMPTIKISAA